MTFMSSRSNEELICTRTIFNSTMHFRFVSGRGRRSSWRRCKTGRTEGSRDDRLSVRVEVTVGYTLLVYGAISVYITIASANLTQDSPPTGATSVVDSSITPRPGTGSGFEGADMTSTWCGLDTGDATITDRDGSPRSVFVSVRRDGSVWLRFGRDHASLEWVYVDEPRTRLHSVLLSQDDVHVLQSIDYTAYCVLTDVEMSVTVDRGWHASHVEVFDPVTRTTKLVLFRHNRDCLLTTNLTLTADKQGLLCDGGRQNACGRRNLPKAGQPTSTSFLQSVNFDPKGVEHWLCGPDGRPLGSGLSAAAGVVPGASASVVDDAVQAAAGTSNFGDDSDDSNRALAARMRLNKNRFTFSGSYYHVYVKMATCPPPKDTRLWGHEAKLRPNLDDEPRLIMIPDPTQSALSNGRIRGWQIFALSLSIERGVFLQVWRPSSDRLSNYNYTLVGQSYIRPTDLRFIETTMEDSHMIAIKRGDVIGIQSADYNPLAWSSVPCSNQPRQRYLYFRLPTPTVPTKSMSAGSRTLHVGTTVTFQTAPHDERHACRHYSLTAVMDDHPGAKVVEDWICPHTSYISTDVAASDGAALPPLSALAGSASDQPSVSLRRDGNVPSKSSRPGTGNSGSGGSNSTTTTDRKRSFSQSTSSVGVKVTGSDVIEAGYVLATLGVLLVLMALTGFASYRIAINLDKSNRALDLGNLANINSDRIPELVDANEPPSLEQTCVS